MSFLRRFSCAKFAVAALVAAVMSASSVYAQTDVTTGRIAGQVLDQDGQPLPGATVEAKSKDTGHLLSQVTDSRGLYRIVNLTVGTYNVTAALPGFRSQERPNVVITIGSAVTANFKLGLATVAETLTVTGEVPVVETTQTETANTVDANAIKSLPIVGRNFTDFVLLTPNAQRETQRGNLALGGQRGINTMVTVDGVDFTNSFFGGVAGSAEGRSPISISQEAVREFQVVQAGASAEYGRSSGGFVNVVTKSGSNDFHGSALGYYRPSSWSAKIAPPTESKDYSDPRESKKTSLGASLGGPLMKDSLFFFGTYERGRQETTVPLSSVVARDEAVLTAKFPSYPVSGIDYVQGSNADSFFGRLDFQATDAHRVTGRVSYTKYDGPNGTTGSTTVGSSHNGVEGMKSLSTVLQWNGMFGKSTINDLNLQYGTEDTPRDNNPAGANLPELQIFDGGSTLGGYAFLPITASQKRTTLYDSVTFLFGQHVAKVGVEYNHNAMDQVFKGNWRGVFIFRSSGTGANAKTALANFTAGKWDEYREFIGLNGKSADEAGRYNEPQNEYAGFLQDQWFATPKLTISLGLRYELQTNPSTPVIDKTEILNPANGLVQPDAKIPNATNQFSPRLSAAYSVDSKTVFRFSAGRYFARFPAILTSQLYTSNGIQGTQYLITGQAANGPAAGAVAPGWGPNFNPLAIQQLGNLPPGTKLAAPGAFVIDPNFKNPHTDQVVLAAEREFMGISFGVEGQYSKGYDLERIGDLNLQASTNPAVDCPLLDPNSGVTCYGKNGKTFRPNPNYGRITYYTSDATSKFWGVTLKLRKNFTNGLRFFGSVTRGSDQDTDSNERNYAGIALEDVNNPNNDYSYSDRDIKWRFLGNLTYDKKITSWLDGFTGVVFNYQTGRPFTPGAGRDLNLDGNTVDRPTVDGAHLDRNSYRLPDFYTLDLRLGVAFTLGPGRLSVFGECFNCTNTANRGITNTTYGTGQTPSATFDLVNTSTNFPRSIQAAARYDF